MMNTPNKQLASRLESVPLFDRCTPRDLRAIARHLETLPFAAGQTIVAQGEISDGFFLVLEGELTVLRDNEVVAELKPGSHFGELALLDPAPRSATVIATTDVELGALSARMFRVVLRDMPETAFGMFASLAEMLREARRTPC